MALTLEICVDSVESSLAAARGGADRLELCGNLGLGGGTTPSLGLFKAVRDAVPHVPVMVMIRPRAGDFLYSTSELRVMREDTRIFKEHGAEGVVFGVLTKDGQVDVPRTRILVDEAYPMQVCFHRAFDMTRDAKEALTALKSIPNITRILTSGQTPKAPSSLPLLASLLSEASSPPDIRVPPLTILPGSGLNPQTLGPLLAALVPRGLREVHMTAGGWADGAMEFRRAGMGMGMGGGGEGEGEWGRWGTREEVVVSVRAIMDSFSVKA